jgi:hypothetical protein
MAPAANDSVAVADFKKEALKEETLSWNEFEDKLARESWETEVAWTRKVFGEDATNFALQALEHEGGKTNN